MRHTPGIPDSFSYIACTYCGATSDEFRVSVVYASDDKAAEAWNRRVNDDTEN